MKLAVPKEMGKGETRVALVPACVAKLVKAGIEVVVQAGTVVAGLQCVEPFQPRRHVRPPDVGEPE